MSPAFMALSTGATEQLDQNLDQTAITQDKLLTERQKVVDGVAARQNAMDSQAQKIADAQQSYEANYGVSPDLAYNLATDPHVDKMSPQDLADYIKTLKPTGQTLPARPRGNAPMIINPEKGSQCTLSGNLRNALKPGGAGFCMPPVYGVQQEAQPARQVYSQPTGASKTDQTKNEEAFKFVFQAISTGQADSGNWKTLVASAGGDPNAPQFSNFNWDAINPKNRPDPASAKKVAMLIPAINALHPGISAKGAADLANFIVAGGIQVKLDQAGNPHGFNMVTGKAMDDAAYQAIEQAVPGAITPAATPGANTATPTNTCQPIPAQPGTQQPTPVASQHTGAPMVPGEGSTGPQQLIMPKLNMSQEDLSKAEFEPLRSRMSETPKIIANLNYVSALASKDPTAIGISGALVKHFGGPAVNLLSLASQTKAQSLSDFIRLGQKKTLDSAINQLQSALMKPYMAMYMPNNNTGMGVGGKEAIDNFFNIFQHEDISASYPGFKGSLSAIKNILYTNYAGDYSRIHTIAPLNVNGKPNIPALAGLHQDLVSQGFSDKDAYAVEAKIESSQQGQGLQ